MHLKNRLKKNRRNQSDGFFILEISESDAQLIVVVS